MLELEGEEFLDGTTAELLFQMGQNPSVLGEVRSSVQAAEEILRASQELVSDLSASGRTYWWSFPSQKRS